MPFCENLRKFKKLFIFVLVMFCFNLFTFLLSVVSSQLRTQHKHQITLKLFC